MELKRSSVVGISPDTASNENLVVQADNRGKSVSLSEGMLPSMNVCNYPVHVASSSADPISNHRGVHSEQFVMNLLNTISERNNEIRVLMRTIHELRAEYLQHLTSITHFLRLVRNFRNVFARIQNELANSNHRDMDQNIHAQPH